MILRSLAFGLALAAALHALFHFAGPLFFLEGRRPFQVNFTLAAAFGLLLGLVVDRALRTPAKAAVIAMAASSVPGLLWMAAVASHFAVFFPALEASLDKVFGSIMLWFYGFALIGALWRTARA